MNVQSNKANSINNRRDKLDLITIDLFGSARLLTDKSKVYISCTRATEIRKILQKLAEAEPKLVGTVISDDGNSLIKSFTLNLNGARFISNMDEIIAPGDNVLIFSSQSGG